jgi:thiol-disulfide isomerase/thioredoxin
MQLWTYAKSPPATMEYWASLLVSAPLWGALLCLATTQETASPQNQQTVQLLKEGNEALTSRRFGDAEKAFKKAAKLEHDRCAPCYLGLAQTKNALEEPEPALAASDLALPTASNDKEKAAIHELRGDVLVKMHDSKKMERAEGEYRTALALNPDQPIFHLKLAIALFKQLRDPQGIEEVQRYLQLAPDGRYSEFARKLAVHPRRAREEYVPAFQFTTLQGQFLASADLEGRVVVLDFWATWCPPCRESIPELKELTRKYPGDKLVLISVSADQDEKQWRDFVARKKMDWGQYWDRDGSLRKLMRVSAFPTYVIVDPEGIIRERMVGLNPQETIVYRLKEKLRVMLPPA